MTGSGTRAVKLEVTPDLRVLAFTLAVTALTTLLFALAPAVRATRVDVNQGLKQDTPIAGRTRFGAIRVLVAAQIGAAMLLVTGAILLERTLLHLRAVPLGFNGANVALFDLAPIRAGYNENRSMQLYTRVLEQLNRTPGVTGATVSNQRLISGWMSGGPVFLEGETKRSSAHFNFVGADFLEVMQIPLVAGRGITARDMGATPRVAVVNETFVRKYLAGRSPVGVRYRWNTKSDQQIEIVGVARDARYDRLRGDLPATVYVPYTQRPFGWPEQMAFEVRFTGDPGAASAAIRHAVAQIDPALPLMDFKTQRAQIDEMMGQERLFAWLVGLFGGITLALACVGLYGLVAASVASRTREIGVRIALGAGRAAVLRLTLGQIALIAGTGLAAGFAAAWSAGQVLKSQLFGVTPHDPATLVIAGALVIVVSLAAAFLPARRALRIDPVRALRYE
jgi:predicted permease